MRISAFSKYSFLFGLLLLGICMTVASSGDQPQLPRSSGIVPVSHGQWVYYESVGEGEPVLFVHGHTLDSRMWQPQVEAFKDHYRVICMDCRGYGRASRQVEGIQFTHVDDVVTLLDSLHLDRVHIVGLSQGSFIASEMVALHPDRLLTALLASGNIRKRKGPATPIDSAEFADRNREIETVRVQGVENWKREWIEKLISGGGSNAESIRPSLTQQVMDWDGWQLLHHEMRLYYGYEAWDSLKARCPQLPVLIVSGEMEHKGKNPMLPYLPKGRQVIIPDCGHMTNMERPAEFNRLLSELLESARTSY